MTDVFRELQASMAAMLEAVGFAPAKLRKYTTPPSTTTNANTNKMLLYAKPVLTPGKTCTSSHLPSSNLPTKAVPTAPEQTCSCYKVCSGHQPPQNSSSSGGAKPAVLSVSKFMGSSLAWLFGDFRLLEDAAYPELTCWKVGEDFRREI